MHFGSVPAFLQADVSARLYSQKRYEIKLEILDDAGAVVGEKIVQVALDGPPDRLSTVIGPLPPCTDLIGLL